MCVCTHACIYVFVLVHCVCVCVCLRLPAAAFIAVAAEPPPETGNPAFHASSQPDNTITISKVVVEEWEWADWLLAYMRGEHANVTIDMFIAGRYT